VAPIDVADNAATGRGAIAKFRVKRDTTCSLQLASSQETDPLLLELWRRHHCKHCFVLSEWKSPWRPLARFPSTLIVEND
jgi:hypothetical protein